MPTPACFSLEANQNTFSFPQQSRCALLLLTHSLPLSHRDTLQGFSPIRSNASHPYRQPCVQIQIDLLLHCASGMQADRLTPVRARHTGRQHNRNAESSVNRTIALLGNRVGQNTGERPAGMAGQQQKHELQCCTQHGIMCDL